MVKIRIKGKIVEQEGDLFSGVLDKNGVEIYENDSIKIYHKGQFVVCSVFFKEGLFGLKWPDGYMNMWPLNSNCEVLK